jgi:hypothetical protein
MQYIINMNNYDFMNDIDIDNYTQKELKHLLKLKDTYSNDELNSQISKLTLKIINNNYTDDYKEKLIFFINDIKDKLQIKINKDIKNEKEKNHDTILSEIIDTKIANIINTANNFNHNPLQYQRLNMSNINLYNEKIINVNYIFNTAFRNNFLNSIPQQCIFQLPEPINNVVRMSLLSIQIPNVMLAFSNSKNTTQIYIKEDVTNFEAIVVIPEGNYDEKTFPVMFEKCINEQVINTLILPTNYRFFVTIDPHTFFITIKNKFYTFTMETITKYPSKLGNCNLNYQLSSTNLTVNKTYKSTVNFNENDVSNYDLNDDLNNVSTVSTNRININYNTISTISDVFLKECIINVKKIYTDSLYTNLNMIYYTLNSRITGSLILDVGLNAILNIKFSTLDADVLYVPLELNNTTDVNGNINTVYSTDNIILGINDEYHHVHNVILRANLLKAQIDNFSKFYSHPGGVTSSNKNHIYALKIYANKTFELIQSNWTRRVNKPDVPFQDYTFYTKMEQWVNHNINNVSISYNPFVTSKSYYKSSSFSTTNNSSSQKIDGGYIKETELFQMATGNIFISQEPNQLYMLNIELSITHYPHKPLSTFPSQISPTTTPTTTTPTTTTPTTTTPTTTTPTTTTPTLLTPTTPVDPGSLVINWPTYSNNFINNLFKKQLSIPKSSTLLTPKSSTLLTPKSSTLIIPKSSTLLTPKSSTLITPKSSTLITPKSSTLLTPTTNADTKLECKSKISNLSEEYNYHFNDLDIKNEVSEISISNTLGYQIGYRSIKYNGLKSYTGESAFDKTSLDYMYFCVDDYNNGYLNHNYGVLPNENILNKNILAIITVKSPQFTTTFDNGSDYIPKLRNYFTPVNIKKIGIKLLDPLGNLVNINTNDYSFVLEFTKLMDINS